MNKKTLVSLGMGAVVGAAAGLAIKYALPPKVKYQADSEIHFTKSLVFKDRSISIDGGAFQKVPCGTDPEKRSEIGFIKAGGVKLPLLCFDEYMNGITIEGPGLDNHVALEDASGDAGDEWDTRTWITKNADGSEFKIETVILLSSAGEEEAGDQLECTVKVETKTWDNSNKVFNPMIDQGNFETSLFTPPIKVAKACLDEKGAWKKKP
jgi:hypothetical protein